MNFTPSRRGFLRGSTLAAAAACISPAILSFAESKPQKTGPAPIRLGVASYSLRKFPPQQVIADLKQLRTPYLNVKDIHLPMGSVDDVKREAAVYRDAEITLTAAGTIYFTKDDDADMRPKFEYVKAAGIPIIVAGPTRETLARVEKFAKEYDVKIAIHNHGPEDKQFPSPLDSLKAVQHMDPRMGVCLDVGHAARAGANVVDAIAQCGPRLFDVHMKDLADMQVKESQVAVGQGKMPVDAIFQALIKLNYKGCVDLEYEIHEDDPMPGMMESFAYMRGVLAGMGYTA
jgi:sugar phosphate isomerase/epimerase